jgi:hypothetical protein
MLDDTFYEDWWSLASWLAPFSATEGFVGFYREEYGAKPTLLHFRAGQLEVEDLKHPRDETA